ncbi:MAG TPA: glutathione peroxidase [Fimbriimonadaceae bacterium]|nr:glutathione peroxidase [Fimbriimonadaceae bacterium]
MITPLIAVMAMQTPTDIYGFTMTDIDGVKQPLSKYRGKTLLIVNVASYCGNTKQYSALEALYRKHKGSGLVILGFPANDFGEQEPGSDKEIKEFCTSKFDVTFPMFSKIKVSGEGKHPLYQWLVSKTEDKKDVEWNFGKFLVSKDGKRVQRFKARTSPDSPEFLDELVKALK